MSPRPRREKGYSIGSVVLAGSAHLDFIRFKGIPCGDRIRHCTKARKCPGQCPRRWRATGAVAADPGGPYLTAQPTGSWATEAVEGASAAEPEIGSLCKTRSMDSHCLDG